MPKHQPTQQVRALRISRTTMDEDQNNGRSPRGETPLHYHEYMPEGTSHPKLLPVTACLPVKIIGTLCTSPEGIPMPARTHFTIRKLRGRPDSFPRSSLSEGGRGLDGFKFTA